MIPKLKDDRTPEEMVTHTLAVVARDQFMSSWGPGVVGSYCAWACRNREELDLVTKWVESRPEMRRVRHFRLRDGKGACYPKVGRGLLHVYVVDDGHPALQVDA